MTPAEKDQGLSFISIDLRKTFPRSPNERLDGICILARAIDKARAAIAGTLGEYVFYDCRINRILFDVLKVSDDAFIEIVRRGETSGMMRDREALAAMRESLESEPMVSDADFLSGAQANDVDNTVVLWIRDTLKTPREALEAMNRKIAYTGPFREQRRAVDGLIHCLAPNRASARYCIELVDREEGRIG